MVESLFNLAPKDSRGQGGDDADHELFQTGTGIFDHAYFPSAIGQGEADPNKCFANTEQLLNEVEKRPSEQSVSGVNLPFLKFGFNEDNDTLKAGLDIGFGYFEAKVGLHTGFNVGVDVPGGVRAHYGVEVGLNSKGLTLDVALGGKAIVDLVGVASAVHAGVGPCTGIEAGAAANLGRSQSNAGLHAYGGLFGANIHGSVRGEGSGGTLINLQGGFTSNKSGLDSFLGYYASQHGKGTFGEMGIEQESHRFPHSYAFRGSYSAPAHD